MAGPIGEAFVKIRPDFSTFEAEIIAGLRASTALTAGIVVPVRAAVSGAAAATAGVESLTASTAPAAAATIVLTDAQRDEIAASVAQSREALAAAGALDALATSEGLAAEGALGLAGSQAAINAAVREGGVLLGGAGAGPSKAAAGLEDLASAGPRAAKGVEEAATASNALRGAIIGVSRITPVAIFGLGVVGTAAVAAAIGVRQAVTATAQFQEQLNIFQVVTQATGDQMSRVSDLAQQLGSDISLPATSALDAADAMTELAKAGLSVFDTMDSVRGVLELAAAAGVNAGQAAQITAFALNAFSLSGTQAVHVADLLAASSIAAQGEITDMALALEQSAAVASQAGVSIDDTATAISLLAKSGLIGSDAGTSLRTFLLRLVPTTKEATQFTKALGIQFADAEGKLKPLPDIIQQYHDALSTLPPVLQQAALQQIFGQDAIRAASILTREGAAGFAEMRKEVERQGAAAEIAGARTKGLSGAAAGLQSSLEGLGITLGGIVDGPLARFIESLAFSVSGLDAAIEKTSGFIDTIKNFAAPDVEPPKGLEEISKQLDTVNGQIDKFKETGDFVPPSLIAQAEDLRKRLQELQPAGLQAAAGIEAARASLGRLQAEAQRKIALDPFVDREDIGATTKAFVQSQQELLQTLTTNLRGSLKLLANLGPEAKGAAADSARDAVRAAVAELKKLGPEGEAAISDLPDRLRKVLKLATAAVQQEAVNFKVPLKFEISANTAELSGSLQAQVADVNQRIGFLTSKLAKTPQGTELFKQVQDALIEARSRRDQLLGQIQAEADQATADAQQKARDAATAINKADQKVIDALAAGRTQPERRVELAQATDEPSAMVVALTRLQTRIKNEIGQARDKIKDAKTLAQTLDRLGDDLFQTTQDLKAARKRVTDAAQQDIVDRSNALTERLGQQVQIADLRGNNIAEIQAIDRAIANAEIRVKNWKKLGTTQTAERLALEQLRKQRRDVIDEINKSNDEQKRGTTAFDLLKEFSDQFNTIAGNLINADQPFAGPTGFTADIAQFLKRGSATIKIDTTDAVGRAVANRGGPEGVAASRDRAIQTNTTAIEKLTNALLGNTRVKTSGPAGKVVNLTGAQGAALFRRSLKARELEEG